MISWPAAGAGYVVQQNTNLTTSNWVTVTNVPAVEDQSQVNLSPSSQRLFFRLKLPTP